MQHVPSKFLTENSGFESRSQPAVGGLSLSSNCAHSAMVRQIWNNRIPDDRLAAIIDLRHHRDSITAERSERKRPRRPREHDNDAITEAAEVAQHRRPELSSNVQSTLSPAGVPYQWLISPISGNLFKCANMQKSSCSRVKDVRAVELHFAV